MKNREKGYKANREQSIKMDVKDIRSTVIEIRKRIDGGSEKEALKNEHVEFFVKYPKLFDVSCNKDFPLQHLEFMLDMTKSISDKTLDEDKANENVFNRLKDDYLAHVDVNLGYVDENGSVISRDGRDGSGDRGDVEKRNVKRSRVE